MTARLLAAAMSLLLVAGCASRQYTPQDATAPPPPKAQPAAPATAPTDGGNAGYYLDDGPAADSSQIAYADIPDAVVRYEKIRPAQNRPYVVLGKRYVPFTALTRYRKRGIASWYGKRYHGRQTASGEIYDMHQMTAAHPILPIPSYVRVTRTATGESIVVRVNDRGPFLQGREIDLSYVAAAKLGIVQAGTGEVIVETIIPPQADAAAGDVGGKIQQAQAIGSAVYIQLAAFSDRDAGSRYIDEISDNIPAAFVSRLSIYQKQTDLYAVQLGPYEDHAQAVSDDEQLCEQYSYCGFLTKRY